MASKKRKSDSRLDEVDRTLYSSFCAAANSISQLYTHTQHQQKVAFQEGERHFAERICQQLKDQQRPFIPIEDVYGIIQNMLDNSGDEMLCASFQSQQISSYAMQQPESLCSVDQTISDGIERSGFTHIPRSTSSDLSKPYAFSSVLSSPNRRCVPPFVSMQVGPASIQSDSTATLTRLSGSAFEECVQHAEELDFFIERYNTNSLNPNTESSVYACDPQCFQQRPHSSDDFDTSMDMHADGNVDAPC